MIEIPTVVNFLSHERQLLPSSRGAHEFGARHRNWRGLWSNIGRLCPTRITDVELMQSILCLVLPDNEDNEEMARMLIEKHGNFADAVSAPLSDHDYVKSFPAIAGVALKLVHAAAERLLQGDATDRPLLSDQRAIQNYLTSKLQQNDCEQVRLLLLDESERLLADQFLANKNSPGFRLDHVEVVKRAVNWGAASVALVEICPSSKVPTYRGYLEDTLNIRDLCQRLNIHFLDHLIIREHETISLKERGIL
jgi:DNA repair protein RadC